MSYSPEKIIRELIEQNSVVRIAALGSSNTQRRVMHTHWFDYWELALKHQFGKGSVLCCNMGVGGETSEQILQRFDRDVVALKPDWVSICIGINDVWRQFDMPAMPDRQVSPEEYRDNVEKMILKVKDQVKGVFLLSPYIMEPNREDFMRSRMDTYVKICRELAQKHGCVFIDLQKLFADYCSIRHSCFIAWDRIHPNEIGAMLIAREFLKHCEFQF